MQERLDMLAQAFRRSIEHSTHPAPSSYWRRSARLTVNTDATKTASRPSYGCDRCKLRSASPADILATEMCPQAAERRQVGLRRRSASPRYDGGEAAASANGCREGAQTVTGLKTQVFLSKTIRMFLRPPALCSLKKRQVLDWRFERVNGCGGGGEGVDGGGMVTYTYTAVAAVPCRCRSACKNAHWQSYRGSLRIRCSSRVSAVPFTNGDDWVGSGHHFQR
jgi:hypothetical protein